MAGATSQGRDPRRRDAWELVTGNRLAAERGDAAGEVAAAPWPGRRADMVLELERLWAGAKLATEP